MRLGAQRDRATPRRVRVGDSGGAVDVAARREVGPLDHLREPLDRRLRIVDEHDEPVDDLGEVVRRDVRRHPHRDARRAVDEEVRQTRRQHGGLLERLVEVRNEVHRVPVDVGEHLVGDLRQTHFRVAHRRGRVAVDRAEVPLPVDERITERELLDHPDQRFVDGRVAVGVVLPEHLTDDARRLLVGAVRDEPELLHGVEHPPVDGLEAVADVR